MKDNAVWCVNCGGNGYFCEDNKTTKCQNCYGFGFVEKEQNEKLNSGDVNADGGLVKHSHNDCDGGADEDEYNSSEDTPPPPPDEEPDELKTRKYARQDKTGIITVKSVSVWKEYCKKKSIVKDNIRMLQIYNTRMKREINSKIIYIKETTKYDRDVETGLKKINMLSLEYSSNKCAVNIVQNTKATNQEYALMLRNALTFNTSNEKCISTYIAKVKQIQKEEESITRAIENKLKESKKQKKKCVELISKMCGLIKDLSINNLGQQKEKSSSSFFSRKKKTPETINRKLLKSKAVAHRYCQNYEEFIENLNDQMNTYFKVTLKDFCEKLDDLDVEINRKIEETMKEQREFMNKNNETQLQLAEKFGKAIDKINVMNDTPNCSQKIRKEVGPLIGEEYLIEYDLSLSPQDILENVGE